MENFWNLRDPGGFEKSQWKKKSGAMGLENISFMDYCFSYGLGELGSFHFFAVLV